MNVLEIQMRQFHRTFDQAIFDTPRIPGVHKGKDVMTLRYELIEEELQELKDWVAAGNLAEAIDGATDLLYVVIGTFVSMGIPVQPFFDEVHRSNMTKVWDDGTVHYSDSGKVLKPPTYSPADIAGVLKRVLAEQNGS